MSLLPWRRLERPDELVQVAHTRDAIAMRYRGIDFDVTRDWRIWFCHAGYKLPWEPSLLRMSHEAGWGSNTADRCIRRVARSIDSDHRSHERAEAFANAKAKANR